MRIVKLIIFLIFAYTFVQAQDFPYRTTLSVEPSPSERICCIFFDKDGLMWLGTNKGLKSYDGYTFKTYRTDAYSPAILPNNTVLCIQEDKQDNLWLGTRDGIVRMNKRTGIFKTYHLPNDNQRIIYTLYTAKDGTLWVGTDGGLSYYQPQADTFHTYNEKTTAITPEGNKRQIGSYEVKAILEDRNGELIIGTWDTGLMRFNLKNYIFRQYPKFNKLNSAFSLFFDKRHRLWVGTWGYGVVRIDNPDNVRQPEIHQYPYTYDSFDTYYKIIEDPVSKNLWACTRNGVSIINPNEEGALWKNYPKIGTRDMRFTNDMVTDNGGRIWLATESNGVLQAYTTLSPFNIWNVNKQGLNTNYIRSLLTNDGMNFWIGLAPRGIAFYNRNIQQTLYNHQIPGFSDLSRDVLSACISSVVQRSNGDILFASNSYGVIVKKPLQNAYNISCDNVSYLKDNYVNTLFESRDKTVWIGQRSGLSIVYPDCKGILLEMKEGKRDFSNADIRHICQDRQGNVWLSTENEGIIRISGQPQKPHSLRFHQYSPKHGNLGIDDVTACLEDSRGRLWAISGSDGILLYNKGKDCFEPKNREYHIQGNGAQSIMEDQTGNLWITNDNTLINIVWGKNTSKPEEIRYFGKEDGLEDLAFYPNSNCRLGDEMFMGSYKYIFSFKSSMLHHIADRHKHHLVITDLRVDDTPFARLDSVTKKHISKENPGYSRHFTIPAGIRKIDVEFSLLAYSDIKKNEYQYKLDGYDEEWHYTNGEEHHVIYQNLPAGTYRLHVKGSNGYGQWVELPHGITIEVLPPWYASTMAFVIYALLFIGCIFVIAKWYKEHLKTKNRLQMGVFLTNITHELLTPLTVISATVYKLKESVPQHEEDFQVIDHNINRTTRLLRQILEVRKSQAGQLKLLVSRGNLTAFIQNICENIRPMAVRHGIGLTVNVPKKEYPAWFDTDKLEKILINLLSNAIKYSREEGNVTLALTKEKDNAVISISDNGIGMSKEKIKHLYTRFFDGDYRQQKITGTGIGLSLTHDLVKLHHGEIKCESTEGEGTTFTVTIPTNKGTYSAQEIDQTGVSRQINSQIIRQAVLEENGQDKKTHPSVFIRKNVSKILIVEDNEELLSVMYQMLSKNYHVLTAKNGKQAMNIIMKEQLDLVVSDIMMPVMDGIELTRQLKADKSFWQLPIILLTAKNKEEDKTEGYATGADAYVTKPFKFEDLTVRIDTLIANRKKIREKITSEQSLSEPNNEDTAHYSDPDKAFVEKATETVLQHLADTEYDRDSFARDMVLGSYTLYNKVKATTGQTIVGFITSIRMKEAQRMLKSNPDILISDLSARVGYNTPKHFSNCFKKEFGIFPKEFAEQVRKRGNI